VIIGTVISLLYCFVSLVHQRIDVNRCQVKKEHGVLFDISITNQWVGELGDEEFWKDIKLERLAEMSFFLLLVLVGFLSFAHLFGLCCLF